MNKRIMSGLYESNHEVHEFALILIIYLNVISHSIVIQ